MVCLVRSRPGGAEYQVCRVCKNGSIAAFNWMSWQSSPWLEALNRVSDHSEL